MITTFFLVIYRKVNMQNSISPDRFVQRFVKMNARVRMNTSVHLKMGTRCCNVSRKVVK